MEGIQHQTEDISNADELDTIYIGIAKVDDTQFGTEEAISSSENEDHDIWQELTDSILLFILSFLDAFSLISASKTCKNWYRLAKDETLWKRLVHNKMNIKSHSLPPGKSSWQAEYQRLEDHVPMVLSDEMTGHTDEIYHISFSGSGRYFSTTGRDASVRIWKFGYPSELYAEKLNLQQHNLLYTRFSEFNQSETLLLVAGLCGFLGGDSTILILSFNKDLPVVYAVNGTNSNFRGAWLDDSTFINGISQYSGFLLEKHTVSNTNSCKKSPQELIEMYSGHGVPLMTKRPWSLNNDFIRVISITTNAVEQPSLEDNIQVCSTEGKAVLLSCCENTYQEKDVYIGMYKIAEEQQDKEGPPDENPFQKIFRPESGGIIGLSISADQRFLAYNYRKVVEEDGELQYDMYAAEIDLYVYDLHTMKDTGEHYVGHRASGSNHLSYIFPAVCDDYVSTGSECVKGYIWDRHYGKILSELDHSEQPGNGGVNAAVFHPNSCEVLLTVGDDRKIKIWRSKSLVREQVKKLGPSANYRPVSGCCDECDDLEVDDMDCSDDSTATCCGIKKKNKGKPVNYPPNYNQ